MKKMLMIALLVPFVGLQAEAQSQSGEAGLLNQFSENWTNNLNRLKLPRDDHNALMDLYNSIIRYTKSANSAAVQEFNKYADNLQHRIEKRSTWARSDEKHRVRLNGIKAQLLALYNPRQEVAQGLYQPSGAYTWFDILRNYAQPLGVHMGAVDRQLTQFQAKLAFLEGLIDAELNK